MPRYFFHVQDGDFSPDELGTELPDIYRAQASAVKLCGELVAELGAKFWDHGVWKLEVCNDRSVLLFTLTLTASDAALAV